MPRMPSPRLLIGRRSILGHYYAITTIASDRRPLFLHADHVEAVAKEIAASDERGDVSTLAWVLMPDHLHWLFRLDSGMLSGTIQKMKMRSARTINRTGQRHGPVWQPGFHDHCIRDERSLQRHARYLVENPLRAGLVDRIEDYPHLWCAWTCESDAR